MELKVLGSNSEGNCYILNRELLLDAGVPIKEIKKGLDFDLSKIEGCLITHSHKDHSKSVKELLNLGINCFMGYETAKEIELENRCNKFNYDENLRLNHYIIKPFECKHDVQCSGYLIYDTRTKEKLLFVTDTYMIPYQFSGVNYFLIEANYSEKILQQRIDNGQINHTLAKRVFHSHFSIENCIEFLQGQDLTQAKKIVLIHLSDGNSNEKEFIEMMYKETNIDTVAADAEQVIRLELEPF